MDLENKVALVTGAGVRIGQAVAVKLGQLGMRLVIHYHHSEEGAKQTIQRLPFMKGMKVMESTYQNFRPNPVWITHCEANFNF